MCIRSAFFASRESYGTARIQDELLDQGIHCGRQRIGRLMKEEGLVPKKARLFRRPPFLPGQCGTMKASLCDGEV